MLERPSNCKVLTTQDINGQPCQLCRVEVVGGTKLLLLNQVWKVLMDSLISWRTLKRLCTSPRGAGDGFRDAGGICKKQLQQLGALGARAQKPILATVPSVIKGLKAANLEHAGLQGVIAGLQALHVASRVQVNMQHEAFVGVNTVSSPQPTTFVFTDKPPTTLPQNPPQLFRRQRISLPASLAKAPVLRLQMTNLKAHAKQPIVVGREGGALSTISWEDVQKEVMLYLGYLHLFCNVVTPDLMQYTRADLFILYIASKHQRGDAASTITNTIKAAKRVLFFWRSQIESDVERNKLSALHEWMGLLASQIRMAFPSVKKNVQSMQAQGTWQNAAQIVAILEPAKAEVMSMCSTAPLTLDLARQLHDITLMCCMFGWLPPPRSACIRTLLIPTYEGACLHADCPEPTERSSNSLYFTPTQGLGMQLAHHKAMRWGVLRFDLPSSIATLLLLYLTRARHVLTDLEVEHPYVFMSRSGRPFAGDTFSSYAKKRVLVRLGGPSMAPHTLRHVYATERSGHDPSVAEDRVGDAFAMGHGIEQWPETNDLLAYHRAGQAAIDAMDDWRASLLSRLQANDVPAPDVAELGPSQVAAQVDELQAMQHEAKPSPSIAEKSTSSGSTTEVTSYMSHSDDQLHIEHSESSVNDNEVTYIDITDDDE